METSSITVTASEWDSNALALVCGVANAGGGTVLLASSTTQRRGLKRLRRVFDIVPQEIKSQLGLTCTIAPTLEGTEFYLGIDVPAAAEPVSYQGRYYLYTSEGNKTIAPDAIYRSWRDDAMLPWEQRTLPFMEDRDLDRNMLQALEDTIPREERRADRKESIDRALAELYLTHPRTHKIVQAGALLLCSNPARFIPGATIHLAYFNQQDVEVDRDITGPLPLVVDQAVQQIFYEILPSISKAKAFTRYLPPEQAVREAITNALLHKNYESGTPVRITITHEQLRIQNAGSFPEEARGAEGELVEPGGVTQLRNPILMGAARRLGMTHGWGEGIARMKSECARAEAAEPQFELGSDWSEVVFPLPSTKRGAAAVRAAKNAARRSGAGAGVGVGAGGRGVQGAGRGTKPVVFADKSIAAAHKLDMTRTDEYVLQVLTTNGRATAARIADVLGVSERTVRRSFKKLRELGFIERIGSDKAGYWNILD